ncbi:putative mitochondrial carnitine:acyl carnitine carrier [Microthyrium microscopicum]|uniref:Putative mitochondrial carnitine:acyl carnitine carrier n=1 Tax=Microthyrium microscopicum TaxID=703497 RepID=A0A6A6TYZ4_9PEZI|nr:putative mitochondrial carnitine:acyl carnitine carrier [Microthyrium microscopicum]
MSSQEGKLKQKAADAVDNVKEQGATLKQKAANVVDDAKAKEATLKQKAADVVDDAKDGKLKEKAKNVAVDVKDSITEGTKEASSDLVKSLRAFASGGVGGICAVLTGHPFDLVKVNLQTAEKGTYNGAMDVVRKIIAQRGAAGLYAGVTAPLYGVTPMFAISFWGYDVGKSLVQRFSDVPSTGFTPAQVAAAGFFSAIPMTAVTAPMERVKVLLQIQGQNTKPGEKPKYAGSLDCARQLYKAGGIRSVYRGTFMTLARDGPGSAAYFATYEIIKARLSPKDKHGKVGKLSLPAVMMAGAAAGVAMWIPVFPVDTVKSRLQSAAGSPTLGGVVRELYSKGGVKAFFPGFTPAIARAIPANAATFLGVELAQQAMGKMLGDAEEI